LKYAQISKSTNSALTRYAMPDNVTTYRGVLKKMIGPFGMHKYTNNSDHVNELLELNKILVK